MQTVLERTHRYYDIRRLGWMFVIIRTYEDGTEEACYIFEKDPD